MSAKKKVSKSPTSFLLEEELLTRFRVACAHRKATQSEVVAAMIEKWIGGVPEKDEQGMTDSTNRSEVRNESGTFNQTDAPIDRKIERKSTGQGTDPGGQETDQLTEIEPSGSTHSEVPAQHTDSPGTAAALEELNRSVAELRASVARVEKHLASSEKSAKSAPRSGRVVPRRKGKHPPGAQSGA